MCAVQLTSPNSAGLCIAIGSSLLQAAHVQSNLFWPQPLFPTSHVGVLTHITIVELLTDFMSHLQCSRGTTGAQRKIPTYRPFD